MKRLRPWHEVQLTTRGCQCACLPVLRLFSLLCGVFLAEHLSQKDVVITRALSDKLQLFAELAEPVIGPEEAASRSRLLLRGDTPELQQGEALLKGAITEGRRAPGIWLTHGSVLV